jgi:hypothetical protein
MRVPLFVLTLTSPFIVFLSAVACTNDDSGNGPNAPDAGGRPLGRGSGARAPEGPIKVPRPNLVGNPLSVARPLIEAGIRDQCTNHTLCVKIELKEGTFSDFGSKCYSSTAPDYATPGSTIYIITGKGSAPCAGADPEVSEQPGSPGNDEQPQDGLSPPVSAPS